MLRGKGDDGAHTRTEAHGCVRMRTHTKACTAFHKEGMPAYKSWFSWAHLLERGLTFDPDQILSWAQSPQVAVVSER